MSSNAPSNYTSLLTFFTREYGISTRFTNLFLSSENLLTIQTLLTKRLRDKIQSDDVPLVQFTDAILGALMWQANRYRDTWVSSETVDYANVVFVENIIESMVARYYETAFWRRWCHQGIPDPNNIPYPVMAERTDFTAEIDTYSLSDPWRQKRPIW